MKRALLCISQNSAHTSRAINALGKEGLTLFRREDHVSYPDIESILVQEEWEAYKSQIENQFDEVYLAFGHEDIQRGMEQIVAFMEGLNLLVKRYICADRFPQNSYEEALAHRPIEWVSPHLGNPCEKNIPLYAIVGTYNEEDIIYATVKHAFMQGCEKVFIVDNGSTDATVQEAKDAGAEVVTVFETKEYDELYRIRLMNDAIFKISQESEQEEIWWLWLDADEFPQGSATQTLKDFLRMVPDVCRVIGGQQINHFPKDKPYYVRRKHPFEFMPYGEEYLTDKLPAKHCSLGHWKHPLHKYVKADAPLRAKSGFHMGYCKEVLYEPYEHIEIHHFPYRDEAETKKRYGMLCEENGRNKGNDTRSPNGKSAILKRHESIDAIYAQEWNKVYIDPSIHGTMGVNPKRMIFSQPVWYEKEKGVL